MNIFVEGAVEGAVEVIKASGVDCRMSDSKSTLLQFVPCNQGLVGKAVSELNYLVIAEGFYIQ